MIFDAKHEEGVLKLDTIGILSAKILNPLYYVRTKKVKWINIFEKH